MWYYASREVPSLNFLSERDDRGEFILDDQSYASCLKKIQANLEVNKKQERGKYVQCAGVRSVGGREGVVGRYGFG